MVQVNSSLKKVREFQSASDWHNFNFQNILRPFKIFCNIICPIFESALEDIKIIFEFAQWDESRLKYYEIAQLYTC